MQNAVSPTLPVSHDLNQLKQQFQQLEDRHAAGTLTDQEYQELRLDTERRILDAVLHEQAPQAQTPSATEALVDGQEETLASESLVQAPERSRARWWVMVVLALAAAVAAYFLVLAPKRGPAGTASSGTTGTQSGAPAGHGTSSVAGQGETVVDGLAARLKNNPQDGEGWAMLARSYRVLGRHAQALEAYQKAHAILGDDPGLLADYAEALALQSNGNLAGEPMKLLERAIKKEPLHIKTLYLLGQNAFVVKDYALAVRYWQKAVQASPADHPQTQQLQTSLNEARRLAGLPAQSAAELKPGSAAVPAEAVSGTVTLAASLAKQVQPEDTVFILATASGGGRMPIAVLRRQVKDLPIRFTLDDRLAMSPETRLSKVKRVNLSARVSKAGSAMPAKGDFTGQVTAVSIGSQDVSIVIQDTFNP